MLAMRKRGERGASAVEYAILVAATAALFVLVVTVFFDGLGAILQHQCDVQTGWVCKDTN